MGSRWNPNREKIMTLKTFNVNAEEEQMIKRFNGLSQLLNTLTDVGVFPLSRPTIAGYRVNSQRYIETIHNAFITELQQEIDELDKTLTERGYLTVADPHVTLGEV